jgi:hypothetical protein
MRTNYINKSPSLKDTQPKVHIPQRVTFHCRFVRGLEWMRPLGGRWMLFGDFTHAYCAVCTESVRVMDNASDRSQVCWCRRVLIRLSRCFFVNHVAIVWVLSVRLLRAPRASRKRINRRIDQTGVLLLALWHPAVYNGCNFYVSRIREIDRLVHRPSIIFATNILHGLFALLVDF